MEDQLGVNEQDTAAPVDAPETTQEDAQAQNWREVNRLLKEQKAAIDRISREKEEMAAMLQQAFQKPQQEEDDELDVYSPDFGTKLEKKVSRAIEKSYEAYEQKKRSDPAYLEEQARKKYSDFDSVMTNENIDSIIKSNPLVHKSVMASGAPLEAAYEFIKSSAAYQSKVAPTVSQKLAADERKKMAEKQATPKSAASVPRSQAISNVMGFPRLTPSQAAEIHAETLRIKRGR